MSSLPSGKCLVKLDFTNKTPETSAGTVFELGPASTPPALMGRPTVIPFGKGDKVFFRLQAQDEVSQRGRDSYALVDYLELRSAD